MQIKRLKSLVDGFKATKIRYTWLGGYYFDYPENEYLLNIRDVISGFSVRFRKLNALVGKLPSGNLERELTPAEEIALGDILYSGSAAPTDLETALCATLANEMFYSQNKYQALKSLVDHQLLVTDKEYFSIKRHFNAEIIAKYLVATYERFTPAVSQFFSDFSPGDHFCGVYQSLRDISLSQQTIFNYFSKLSQYKITDIQDMLSDLKDLQLLAYDDETIESICDAIHIIATHKDSTVVVDAINRTLSNNSDPRANSLFSLREASAISDSAYCKFKQLITIVHGNKLSITDLPILASYMLYIVQLVDSKKLPFSCMLYLHCDQKSRELRLQAIQILIDTKHPEYISTLTEWPIDEVAKWFIILNDAGVLEHEHQRGRLEKLPLWVRNMSANLVELSINGLLTADTLDAIYNGAIQIWEDSATDNLIAEKQYSAAAPAEPTAPKESNRYPRFVETMNADRAANDEVVNDEAAPAYSSPRI